MRYKLINHTFSPDLPVYEIERISIKEGEPEKEGEPGELFDEQIKEIPTDKYFCSITLNIQDIESENPTPFTRSIIVESHNNETGFEVDATRKLAVEKYMNSLNNKP